MDDKFFLLSEDYNKNGVLRLLIKLIPYGSIVDSKLASFYTKEKERRLKVFYDELAAGTISLTEDQITTDDFLHKYYITVKAVLETRRNEKIIYFAKLLKNSFHEFVITETDSYEDFLKALDDLTYQEIFVLNKIREAEKKHSVEGRNPIMANRAFYREFKKELALILSISEDEVLSIYIRLGRTGCVNLEKNMAQLKEVHDSIATTDFFKKLEMLAIDS